MNFSPKVIQALKQLIDQHLQDHSSDDVDLNILIKCRQELNAYPQNNQNPLPLIYSRRQLNNK